jgi:hypothetical protein
VSAVAAIIPRLGAAGKQRRHHRCSGKQTEQFAHDAVSSMLSEHAFRDFASVVKKARCPKSQGASAAGSLSKILHHQYCTVVKFNPNVEQDS